MGMPRSLSILFSQTASLEEIVVPLYLGSVIDSATVGCFLLLQDIALLSREKKNLEVDCLSAL